MRQQGAPAKGITYPAPVGGWNAYSSLDAMEPNEAVILDNWFPETTYVRLRRGSTVFCSTGAAGPVKSLMDWSFGTAGKLLAAASGSIYEVSSGTAASLGTGFTSDVWQHICFSTLGGAYTIAVNGVDPPQSYDGTALSAAGFSGPANVNALHAVCAHGQRLWFAEAGTLTLWYGATGAITGALNSLPMGPFCSRGGQISAIGAWTRDNVYGGVNELLVVTTSNGEVLIFSGTDPTNASSFSLVGRFVLGVPASGGRVLCNLGPDVVLICEDGFQPLSNYLALGQSKAESIALSAKIGNAATAAVRSARTLFGWDAALYPAGNMMLFNVPQQDGSFQQYVVNTVTGAWCRFLGMSASCWRVFNSQPYFGGPAGVVYLADTGTSDNGAQITADLKTAFQYPGGRGSVHRFTMVRPTLQVTGSVTPSLQVEVDFQQQPGVQPVASNVNVGTWGTMLWGSGQWAASQTVLQRSWFSVSGMGYAAALRLRLSTSTISVNVNSFDLLFERGAFL